MKRFWKISLLTLCVLIFLCSMVQAQSEGTGAIVGKVTSPDGEILPGVEVRLSSPDLIGGDQATITNNSGRYRFVALPRGIYSVEARLQGFTPQKREDIRLSVQMTLTVDFVLEVGALTESIEVIGTAPTIDVKDSQTATTEMPKEFLEKIPSGRSMRSQLKFAPGVFGSSHPSVYGSSQSLSNNFMIDGVKINSPEAGEAEVSLDFDSIEEMKVMGIGAPAEYGGFAGAVVNTLTKSGGNDLSALFTFFMQHQSWHSANWGNNEDLIIKDWDAEYGFHLNIGGPIIRDNLWYYISGKYERFKIHIEDFEGPTEYGYEARVLGKLNWQIDQNNRFTGWFGYQKDPVFNIEAGPLTAPESVPVDQRWQTYWNASFLHVFSDVTFLEAKFGGYFQRMNLELQSDNPAHFDLATEELSGNFWEYWEGPRERYQINTSVSHHAEEFIGGSHDFKFGAEVEISPLANRRGFPGGKFYYDLDGEPYIMAMYDGYAAEPTTNRVSAFIQDSWTIGDRLTINPGIRINHVRGNLPDPLGAVYKPKLGIAPRLGITFDLFGDHSTALKAHYGKYYHGIMGMFYLHFQPQGTYAEYFWEDGEWVLDFEDVWEDKYTVDPDLKMAYMNQYVVGFERELGRDISIEASFIHRTNHDFMDRVNITGEWEPVQWTDPYFGKTYTVYQRLNPGENQFYITNPKEGEDYGAAFKDIVGFTPTRKYTGFEITFNKRYSNRWQLQASYVYGKATGSDDNAWGEYAENRTSSLGASTKYSNPNYQINAVGPLSHDPRHMLKIMGSYNIPVIDVNLGFYYSYLDGTRYNKNIMLDEEIDPDAVSWSHAVYIYADPKGTYKYKGQHNLDLRLEKFFRISNKYRVGVLVDIFNALNDDTVTDVETAVDPWSEFPFGYVWGIRGPRQFRAGFRFEF